MTIIDKLATSLNRKDEGPNQELAKYIADHDDKGAVKELVDNLYSSDKNIQSDCIKVLYEIGVIKPSLVVEYSKEFVTLLDQGNNRLVWGAMTALDVITLENPETIYLSLATIVDIADKGSVITKDHAVNILIKLCAVEQYADHAFTLLIEQLKKCPTNQLPMYAENAISIVNEKNKALFIETLISRLDEIEKDTKRKRVEKLIKKLS
ncbi:hypothetical protein GCM10008018_58750 [Paenibacillus marchantiophytorum]|uniref:HEAT repeat domain-containing protein n=1 Tax=Paenibacillus marchantiophytorum TaxID=1619310 RepID=A0ABQ1FC40_9BACL|nr:hypothetical protein [Paenibacillus marchantiophytorum]GGA05026.1 hypothetical protein GCM10008018_58750 [Paenibacillus marchantiophytorum]